jgi:NTP pyrophosphatase (non-canonical NTP hydrolase)
MTDTPASPMPDRDRASTPQASTVDPQARLVDAQARPVEAQARLVEAQARLVDVRGLARAVEEFATERDWTQFHTPKNLAMALTGELGELVEIFQWMSPEQSSRAGSDPETAQALRDELADVLIYLVRLAEVLGVDLDDAVRAKLARNALKYPADKVRGSHRKYDKL